MAKKNDFISSVDKIIGRNIQLIRLSKGWSQDELGKKTGVTHQQIRKYENGSNRISIGRLILIGESLETKLEDFLKGINQENSEKFFTPHHRLCIEVSRNFMKVENANHQNAIHILIKTLANTHSE